MVLKTTPFPSHSTCCLDSTKPRVHAAQSLQRPCPPGRLERPLTRSPGTTEAQSRRATCPRSRRDYWASPRLSYNCRTSTFRVTRSHVLSVPTGRGDTGHHPLYCVLSASLEIHVGDCDGLPKFSCTPRVSWSRLD